MRHSAELYNLRLVYEWHRWHGTASLPDKQNIIGDADRARVIEMIESLPVPQELMPRLMWEPYLA